MITSIICYWNVKSYDGSRLSSPRAAWQAFDQHPEVAVQMFHDQYVRRDPNPIHAVLVFKCPVFAMGKPERSLIKSVMDYIDSFYEHPVYGHL